MAGALLGAQDALLTHTLDALEVVVAGVVAVAQALIGAVGAGLAHPLDALEVVVAGVVAVAQALIGAVGAGLAHPLDAFEVVVAGVVAVALTRLGTIFAFGPRALGAVDRGSRCGRIAGSRARPTGGGGLGSGRCSGLGHTGGVRGIVATLGAGGKSSENAQGANLAEHIDRFLLDG